MEYRHFSKGPLNRSRRQWLKGGLASLFAAPLLRSSAAEPAADTAAVAHGTSAVTASPSGVGRPGGGGKSLEIGALFEQIKREATPEQLYRFLYAMPKGGDIHHHLSGGFLPFMWLSIAQDSNRNGGQTFYTRYRVTTRRRHPLLNKPGVSYIFLWRTLNEANYKSLDAEFQNDFKPIAELSEKEAGDWMSSVVLDEANEGRNEFFEYHWTRLGDLMASIHVVSELLVENMKLFGAEGTRYMELQRGYSWFRDADGALLPPEIADAFWADRLAQPDALATGVTVRWQAVVIRFADNAEAVVREHFAHIDANRDQWVGINMAGREDDNRGYPSRFTRVYDEMLGRYPGIGISIHAGEAEKPDSHIRDTLRLGASRIGHGINLISDSDTLLRMRDSSFLVEINLVSNELLNYVPDLSKHPFPVYLRQGVPCCLNTDDRGMWDSNFTDEYYVAASNFNLSWDELVRLGRNSYVHSFAEPALKQRLLAAYEADLKEFAAKFSTADWRARIDAVPAITHGYGQRVLGLQVG
jgi:adenosine deaminase CECR1